MIVAERGLLRIAMIMMQINLLLISTMIPKSRQELLCINSLGHLIVNIRWAVQLLKFDPVSMRLSPGQISLQLVMQLLFSGVMAGTAFMINDNLKRQIECSEQKEYIGDLRSVINSFP